MRNRGRIPSIMNSACVHPKRRSLSLRAWAQVLAGAFLIATTATGSPVEQQTTSGAESPHAAAPLRHVEIVQHGGYPEMCVDGAPFFIHSAAFFYYRVPREMWDLTLERYRAAGINTIDLYIPWNWHEPAEGALDFDGHSNPRRDLRGLLRLIAQKRLHLIARPGPEILNEWRNGGYPDWLLERPEYKMEALDRLEGRYPPLDNLNAHDAEAAAAGWLANETHMRFAREWLTAVATELVPFSETPKPHDTPDAKDAASPAGPRTTSNDTAGTLLFVQLGDDFAIGRTNRVGPDFWRYVQRLREAIEAGGVRSAVFINPTDMRVSASGSQQSAPIGVMGQWYLRTPAEAPAAPAALPGKSSITPHDVSEIEFFTEELKTQPAFPPAMIEYQAGWYAPGDDDRPPESAPENTLLSSRLLIANGIHGINYLPLQDTYTPAGYSVPWANRGYRWDAAFGPDGERQPRLRAIQRNGRLLDYWGPMLAASHKRADFGLVYPLGAYPQAQLQADDIRDISQNTMRIERLAHLALLSSELLDPEYQSVDQLLRHAVVFLPVPESKSPQYELSKAAQHALVEYVRQGGTLVVFPLRPSGKVIEDLFRDEPDAPTHAAGESGVRARWKFGEGEVIESSKDFFSWIHLDESFSRNRARPESQWALRVLREILTVAGVHASVRLADKMVGSTDLAVSEIVTNDGTALLGQRTGGRALLSVTNFSNDETSDVSLDVLSPEDSTRSESAKYVSLHVAVPPHESLLLPIQVPICFSKTAADCRESLVATGAEFLGAQREGKTLECVFYVPARAEVQLHVDRQPGHILLEETQSEAVWTESEKKLVVSIPRGAAPGFLRTLKIDLPYKPDVPEAQKPGKPQVQDFDFAVANAIRLPAGGGSFVRTYPPLVELAPNRQTTVLIQAENRDPLNPRDGVASIDGDLRGSGSVHVPAPGISIDKVRIRPADKAAFDASTETFLHGTVRVQVGKDDRSVPVTFLKLRDTGTTKYRYDFDRDGADEWVLENASLRLILSPEAGGQGVGFIDKVSGGNLSTSVGLFRDAFSYTPQSSGASQRRPSGRWGLFNRPYKAEWTGETAHPALKMSYDASDVFPGGARIAKTVKLENDTAEIDYQIELATQAVERAGGEQAQSFVSLNSFPAAASEEHPTRFCWRAFAAGAGGAAGPTNSIEESGASSAGEAVSAEPPCQDFVRGGTAIVIPEGSNRVEIRTPGRPATAIEWDCDPACARLTIEPKLFSAWFRLEFPPLVPGAAAHYRIRIVSLGSP